MYKIKKYVYKINKAIFERQTYKFDNYLKHFKHHANIMIGGDSLENKVNELEDLLNKLKTHPKFGINDTLEVKIKKDEKEFAEFNYLVNKTIRGILKDAKFDKGEIDKIIPKIAKP
jgi:hypothetical protein